MSASVSGSSRLLWLAAAEELLARLAAQGAAVEEAARWCADAIAADGLVHLFGTGYSRIAVEEVFPRLAPTPASTRSSSFDGAYREHARRPARAIISQGNASRGQQEV